MGRRKGSKNVWPLNRAYCRQCGKVIEGYTDEWAYRRLMRMAGQARTNYHTFCSWSCLCKAQHESEAMYGVPSDPYEKTLENTEKRWRRRYARIKEEREKKKAQEEA